MTIQTSSHHASLSRDSADLIGGEWTPHASRTLCSRNPARPDETVWSGSSRIDHVAQAIDAARRALPAWAATPMEKRIAVLRRFQANCKSRLSAITTLIRDETGKVQWDAAAEASLLGAKVDITLDDSPTGAMRRVTAFDVPVSATRTGRAWFKPHGVMAVVGPYNFPMHLPNGHIVPALAMGNTIVFKPSDKTPACGQLLAELFDDALRAENAPPGVLNLVQGAADVASSLVSHPGIDGILFTGSWPVGRRIMEANLDRPSRLVALEMGGNNAAVVMDDCDLRQGVVECVRCAFITTGQRCTCTRRVIVHEAIAPRFIAALCKAASNLIVGDPGASHPVFMGPIISEQARAAVLEFQASLARAGGEVLVPSTPIETPTRGWYLSPGVVRVDCFTPTEQAAHDAGCDIEVFGPLVRIAVVKSLDEAIEQANATRYGLAAAIFTKNQDAAQRFLHECRAGCINVNTGTAGASSKLPFGGLGLSGNHRPAGAFSLDYCAYPVAAMTETGPDAPLPTGMMLDDAWLAAR
ncbi:MAG: aldehyde dehydrogenase family protein [Phycisphaerales bacterium]|nr:aldehyde dehydrogenase family protein [Phycisphaerales bacterium]